MVKRLIKKSEFMDGFMYHENMISIFKNPNRQEIDIARNENDYKSIRGLIYLDGTEYCWSGNALHDSSDISNVLDVDQFRFACESENWIFDLHYDVSFTEGIKSIIKYKNKLSKYGDLNKRIDIYYSNTSSSDEFKYIIDSDLETGLDISCNYCISANSFDELKNGYDILISEYSNDNIELEQTGKKRLIK